MSFEPPRCPNDDCPSHDIRCAFRYVRNGRFRRQCDRRFVQRFRCLVCERGFSTQTFHVSYRHKRPELNRLIAFELVSKCTLRQAARKLGCTKRSVTRRVPLLGDIARATHEYLSRRGRRFTEEPFRSDYFLMDELETYSISRRNDPLTVPVLIHHFSYFVVHTDVGPLPRRGGTGRDEAEPAPLTEEERRERNAGSRVAVGSCCRRLAEFARAQEVFVMTDQKRSYPKLLRDALGRRLEHLQTHSKQARNTRNPLFRINLTLAMMRDGISRLVRRTWAASKRRERLLQHLWVWVCYRNYVRGRLNRLPYETPAMAARVLDRQVDFDDLFVWRAPYVPDLLTL